jgi:hypothetical protein
LSMAGQTIGPGPDDATRYYLQLRDQFAALRERIKAGSAG